MAGRGPDGSDDRDPVEKTGREKCFSPLTAGVLLCAKSLKALHMTFNEDYDRGSVAFEPGYNVGMSVGNCSLTAILTTFIITSVPGDKTRSLPVTTDTSTRNSRLKSGKACRYTLQKHAT